MNDHDERQLFAGDELADDDRGWDEREMSYDGTVARVTPWDERLAQEFADNSAAMHSRHILESRLADLLGVTVTGRVVRSRPGDGPAEGETLRQRLTRERDDLEAAVAALAAKLARRTAQLEHLDRFPNVDPFADGDVLEFERTFPGSDQAYRYVALRAEGRWFLTGQRAPQNCSWDRFVAFMGLGVAAVYKIADASGRSVRRTKVLG